MNPNGNDTAFPGLTKRELIAAVAMHTLMRVAPDPQSCATRALQYADALLEALARDERQD